MTTVQDAWEQSVLGLKAWDMKWGQIWIIRWLDGPPLHELKKRQDGMFQCCSKVYADPKSILIHLLRAGPEGELGSEHIERLAYIAERRSWVGPESWHTGSRVYAAGQAVPVMIYGEDGHASAMQVREPAWKPLPGGSMMGQLDWMGEHGPLKACDGCGKWKGPLAGPPSQRLCPDCDRKRIEAPSADPVFGTCAGCRMESLVANCGGALLCLWCTELEDETKRLAPARPQRIPFPLAGAVSCLNLAVFLFLFGFGVVRPVALISAFLLFWMGVRHSSRKIDNAREKIDAENHHDCDHGRGPCAGDCGARRRVRAR